MYDAYVLARLFVSYTIQNAAIMTRGAPRIQWRWFGSRGFDFQAYPENACGNIRLFFKERRQWRHCRRAYYSSFIRLKTLLSCTTLCFLLWLEVLVGEILVSRLLYTLYSNLDSSSNRFFASLRDSMMTDIEPHVYAKIRRCTHSQRACSTMPPQY